MIIDTFIFPTNEKFIFNENIKKTLARFPYAMK